MRPLSVRIRNFLWKGIQLLPLEYRLAARVTLIRANLSSFEREWHILSLLGPCKGTALDIGANRGFYSYKLAGLYERVVAFEPNFSVTDELRAIKNPRIDLRSHALSDIHGCKTLFIPKSKNGRALDGWGSLDATNLRDSSGVDEIKVETTTLDSLNLSGITFVKMDVEGHEVQVLNGGQEMLARDQPTVLIEVREQNIECVRSIFNRAGLAEKKSAHFDKSESNETMFLFSK